MSRQAKQKSQHDEHAKSRSLIPGAAVLARDYHGPDKWVSGTIVQRLGPITYSIDINGRIVKRHIDQLKPCVEIRTPPEVVLENSTILDNQHYPIEDEVQVTPDTNQAAVRRFPRRQHRPPDCFGYDCPS